MAQPNTSAPSPSPTPNHSNDSIPAESSSERLRRIRAVENSRLEEERRHRLRLAWSGTIVGAMIGMFVGYLGTSITFIDAGIGEFGFRFQRPDFLNSYLRISFAYLVPGALIGGGVTYILFATRTDAASPIRWIIAGITASIGIPLLTGFFLPLTLLIFVDFWEGLSPGRWIPALAEEFLGSFLDGFIYMVEVIYAGIFGGITFVILMVVTHILWLKDPLQSQKRRRPKATYFYYGLIVLIVSALPTLLLAFGPFGLLTWVLETLTGEQL